MDAFYLVIKKCHSFRSFSAKHKGSLSPSIELGRLHRFSKNKMPLPLYLKCLHPPPPPRRCVCDPFWIFARSYGQVRTIRSPCYYCRRFLRTLPMHRKRQFTTTSSYIIIIPSCQQKTVLGADSLSCALTRTWKRVLVPAITRRPRLVRSLGTAQKREAQSKLLAVTVWHYVSSAWQCNVYEVVSWNELVAVFNQQIDRQR